MNKIIFWIDICYFNEKSPFCLFWTLFGQFLGTFPIQPVSLIPWLLNWIIFWIESAYFFYWMIFWIESWVKQYWIKYWINHFLAKFKHWIESDRVSATTNPVAGVSPSTFSLPSNPTLRPISNLVQQTSPTFFCSFFQPQQLLPTRQKYAPPNRGGR